MTVTLITRLQAVAFVGMRLPYGYHWYLVTGMEWYPQYGDWRHVWAGSDGLSAVIGNQKATKAKEQAA